MLRSYDDDRGNVYLTVFIFVHKENDAFVTLRRTRVSYCLTGDYTTSEGKLNDFLRFIFFPSVGGSRALGPGRISCETQGVISNTFMGINHAAISYFNFVFHSSFLPHRPSHRGLDASLRVCV